MLSHVAGSGVLNPQGLWLSHGTETPNNNTVIGSIKTPCDISQITI